MATEHIESLTPQIASCVKHHRFVSPSMRVQAGFNVYMPPSRLQLHGKRLPVIYWLHGLHENEFKGLKILPFIHRAIEENRIPPVIIVFANGFRSSMYYDSPDGTIKAETWLIQELIPYMDEHFPTLQKREGRLLEGFSMGGFGAVRLLFKFPERFSAALSHAGALHHWETFQKRRPELASRFFGNDAEYFSREGIHQLALTYSSNHRAALPVRLKLLVGDQDPTFPLNEAFHQFLADHQINHEYEVLKGITHNLLQYYLSAEHQILSFLSEQLMKAR